MPIICSLVDRPATRVASRNGGVYRLPRENRRRPRAPAVTLPESRHNSQDAQTDGESRSSNLSPVSSESAPLTGIRLAVYTRPNKLHKACASSEWWRPGLREGQRKRLLENDRRGDGATLIR
jgi:hypothetical protein